MHGNSRKVKACQKLSMKSTAVVTVKYSHVAGAE
jgi:hypothetical protein